MVTFLWLQALLCEQVMHPAQTIALEFPEIPKQLSLKIRVAQKLASVYR